MANITEDFMASSELNEKLCFGKAWPLPQLSKPHINKPDTYEVIIVGAGPAGLLLTLELARLGLHDESLLCIDAKDEGTKTGHADGVNARSLEILRTLGLEGEILREGNTFSEMAHWGRSEQDLTTNELKDKRAFEYTSAVWLDEDMTPEYPVCAVLEYAGKTKTIRAKYLVGADGAHSVVRKSMNICMQGDITDSVWGVIDFVADTNFPDIRRPTNLEGYGSGRGDGLLIPRERLSDGTYTTRLYIDMTEDDDLKGIANGVEKIGLENVAPIPKTVLKRKKAEITANAVLEKGAKLLNPYRFGMKQGTQPFWWAAYSVGQRLADRFVVSDAKCTPRIFLAGDACHTHSPRQGQGMNISMQDSHNLAWKLAYAIFSLTPTPSALLQTYESEHRPAASKVVFFDKRWNQSDMPREQKLLEAKDQILGTSVEYDVSILVGKKAEDIENARRPSPVNGKEYASGVLRTGRRLLNMRVRRFADGTRWDIHDDLVANGRYRVVVICGSDFPDPKGKSLSAVVSVCGTLVKNHPLRTVEAIVLQPDMQPTWHFDDLPACLKDEAEMRLHCAGREVYDAYGVDVERGALVLVRPDGMVGVIADLEDVDLLNRFLKQVLVARMVVGESRSNGV